MCSMQKFYPVVGITQISTANPNLDGTGTMSLVVQGIADGTTLRTITIKATGDTSQGMVRFFIDRNMTKTLYAEVSVSAVTQGVVPAFVEVIPGLLLEAGDSLYASTQNAENFVITAEGVSWVNCECTNV